MKLKNPGWFHVNGTKTVTFKLRFDYDMHCVSAGKLLFTGVVQCVNVKCFT